MLWLVVVSFPKNLHLQSLTEGFQRHICHNFLNIGQNRTVITLAEICTVCRPNLCVCKVTKRYNDKGFISVCRVHFVTAKSHYSSHPFNQGSFHWIHWRAKSLSKLNRQGTRAMTLHVLLVSGWLWLGGCIQFPWWERCAVERMKFPQQTASDVANWYVGHSSWEEKALLSFRDRSVAAGCKWGEKSKWTGKKQTNQKLKEMLFRKYIVTVCLCLCQKHLLACTQDL